MLAQTCPMTTLTVVNVDAADRPAAPGVHDGRDRTRSCKIAKVQRPTRAVWCELIVGLGACAPTGDPQEQVGRSTLRTARPPCWRRPPGVPILAGWGSSGIWPKRNTPARTHAGWPTQQIARSSQTA